MIRARAQIVTDRAPKFPIEASIYKLARPSGKEAVQQMAMRAGSNDVDVIVRRDRSDCLWSN